MEAGLGKIEVRSEGVTKSGVVGMAGWMTAEEVKRMIPRRDMARLALDALVDVLVALDGACRLMGLLVEE